MQTNKVNISNIIDKHRMDASFFMTENSYRGYVSLSKYVSVKGGKRIPKGEFFSFQRTDYLYLRLSDIDNFEAIDFAKFNSISEDLFIKLHRYQIEENELIISIAGTIGRTFIVKNIPIGKKVILTENCAKLVLKDNNVLPEYLRIVLESNIIQEQIYANRIKTTIPKIGLDRIGRLKLPAIPHVDIQSQIVEQHTQAQEAKQTKDREAKSLLDSIDSFILKTLGVILPSRDTYAKENKVTLSQLIGNRYDPYYHNEYFEEAFKHLKETSNYNLVRLRDISLLITSGITPKSGGDDYTDSEHGVAFIRSGNIDIMGEVDFDNLLYIKREVHDTRMKSSKVQNGDIMIAIVGATIGQVGIYHSSREANINQAIALVRLKDVYNPEYIKEVIKSSIGQLNLDRLKRPVARANINLEEISTMLIPVPEIEVQDEIVKSIVSIRQQAKRLQKEGVELLEKTKQEIENIILGNL